MQYLFRNWYSTLERECEKSSSLKIISPFVSNYFFHKIKSKFSLENIELVTRFNLKDFANGVSNLDALKLLNDNKAKIFGVRDIHSKVYIFDDDRAIVSSANVTQNGLHKNFECGVLINGKNEVKELLSYFNKLKNIGIKNQFDSSKYKLWKGKIKECEVVNSPKISLEDFGSVNFNGVDSSRNYYIKIFGTSDNRKPLSFTVREEVDRSLCHYACGFSMSKRPVQINDNDVIYLARITTEPDDYAIFGKGLAIKHVNGRDSATLNEINERGWKKKWPLYLRLKDVELIDGTLGDCTLMNCLIDELDYLSFVSTVRRYKNGERDIKPKRSLSQQPYVKLSLQGAKWVEKRFQCDKLDLGLIDAEFLDKLPRPDIEVK